MTLLSLVRRLLRDRNAVAMTEFAFALPIVLPAGLFGVEMSNYGITQMRLNQAGIALADNAARVGIDTTLATQQIREVDVNDVLLGLRMQTGDMKVTQFGRVTVSSLEVNADGGQWIHWQRCAGLRSGQGWDAADKEGAGKTGKSFPGMGNGGGRFVTAPPGSAVMYVEINYEYQPLIPGFFVGERKLRTTSSFIVRDNRDLPSGVSNPAPSAKPSTCDLYTQ
jgi:hypothetical protein